jgi:hypothetical protein
MEFCRDLQIAAYQWADSRVVNCVSSYLDFNVDSVLRQVGSKQQRFPCPTGLTHYQQHMGGVDCADQLRSHFGGFAAQLHFKKWYKKTIMAKLDCMILNALVMWNMSCGKVEHRKELTRFEFLQVIAHKLLHYKTEELVSPDQAQGGAGRSANDLEAAAAFEPQERHEILQSNGKHRCLVCHLELCQYKKVRQQRAADIDEVGAKHIITNAASGLRRQVLRCPQCSAHAHTALPANNKQFIHNMFPGLTCMEIIHSKGGKEIWNAHANEGRMAVRYTHSVVEEVRLLVEESLMK